MISYRIVSYTHQGNASMFQTAELGQQVSRAEYKERELVLRQDLLALQQRLRSNGKFPVILDFAGVRGAGKGTLTNLLNKWMDARWIVTEAYNEPSDEEVERPVFWSFWNCIQRAGRMTIFDRSWYGRVLVERVENFAGEDEWKRAFAEINDFEEQ